MQRNATLISIVGRVILLSVLVATVAGAQSAASIDPLLGADAGGNVFVGPSLPFGMAKPGPDTGDNTSNSGWTAKGDLNGFSQLHVSGTGGAPKYGNILVQPTTGVVAPTHAGSRREEESASAGFYAVTSSRYGVRSEVTTARHTSLYRFTYHGSAGANLLFDVGHILIRDKNRVGRPLNAQMVSAADVRVISATEIEGSVSTVRGWNFQLTPYTVYFYAAVDTPATGFGTWVGDDLHASNRESSYLTPYFLHNLPLVPPPLSTGAWLSFASRPGLVVRLKIGLSFISVTRAKQNATKEVPGFDFDGVHRQAVAAWNNALAPIHLSAANPEEMTKFATAMYHTLLMPVDRSGENPLWSGKTPYYDDFYCLWDTFRTSLPLMTLIDQPRTVAIVQSLIDIQQHEGWLPDGRSGNFSGNTQGGSDADMVLADAFLKHLPGIDWDQAYRAVVQDAENEPEDYLRKGRGDLEEWHNRGYLSLEGTGPDRPGSRTMEYAANDYAIALMARGLHHDRDEGVYLQRAAQWKNLWDSEAVKDTEEGSIRGFIWPRHSDGTWLAPFNAELSGSWHESSFYEGTSWTYSLFVPQDNRGLIEKAGGADAFAKRLDAFFLPGAHGRFDVGNEPGFLSPYLYNWIGKQSRTAFQVRRILQSSYHSGPAGLPGNDDSGAMSSLFVFDKLGFFPVAAQDVYLIGSPFFPESMLKLPNGKTFTIVAHNVSETNLYIASAIWNGKPYNRSWFTNEELMEGGTLTFEMTSAPVHWDTGAPPPSSSDPNKFRVMPR
jgi:predicted alpha-1,2-mannosidase